MKRIAILLASLLVLTTSSYAFAAKELSCANKFYTEGAYQGIPYLSGGVGKEERSCLAPMEKEYNLMMIFALNSRPYLADQTVMIQDQQGKEVFHGKADGPWLMLKLPAGDYKVTVSREGHRSEVQHVKVAHGTQVERFLWRS